MALAILCLKALDGTGSTPVNLPDAVKFLTRPPTKAKPLRNTGLARCTNVAKALPPTRSRPCHWYELSPTRAIARRCTILPLLMPAAPRRNET